jgi:pimeloyl-ACP methyl ester carboxylesterase
MSRSKLLLLTLVFTALGFGAGGCSSMKPGEMSDVKTISDRPRVGNVYLLRGWIGIFSTGIDHLGEEINAEGVRATVYQDDQWRRLADTIADVYTAVPEDQREPVVLIGHSYGADDVVNIARRLDERHVKVDLVVTIDPTTPPPVPSNIVRTYNVYRNGLADFIPVVRGIPLKKESPDAGGELVNVNINTDPRNINEPGTDHFNIEKKAKVHAVVIEQVLAVCKPRQEWAAAHPAAAAAAAAAAFNDTPPPHPVSPATQPVMSASGNHESGGVN